MTGSAAVAEDDEHEEPQGELQRLEQQWSDDLARARTGDLSLAEQLALLADPEPRVKAALAQNPGIHPDIQRRLAEQPNCRWALISNPNLSAGVQVDLVRRGRHASGLMRRAVIHPTAQMAIIKHGSPKDVAALCRHRSLAPEILAFLALEESQALSARLAGNPAVAGELLTGYACARPWALRAGAAANPNLDPESQSRLAKDRSVRVRRALAANPSLLATVLPRLAEDPDEEVRAAVAGSSTLDANTAYRLVQDPALTVVAALAGNPAVPPPMARTLVGHSRDEVRRRLAGNPRLDARLQRVLADDTVPHVVRCLAANIALTEELLWQMANHRDKEVRANVAAREDLPPHLQQALARDPVRAVRLHLASRRDLDPQARRILVRTDGVLPVAMPRGFGRADVRDLLLHGSSRDRQFMPYAGRPQDWDRAFLDRRVEGPMAAARTGRPWVISTAVEHPDPLVRIGVLANPRTRIEQIERLFHDPVPEVVHAARVAVLARL
jgi:hypothetical protein